MLVAAPGVPLPCQASLLLVLTSDDRYRSVSGGQNDAQSVGYLPLEIEIVPENLATAHV